MFPFRLSSSSNESRIHTKVHTKVGCNQCGFLLGLDFRNPPDFRMDVLRSSSFSETGNESTFVFRLSETEKSDTDTESLESGSKLSY